MPDQPAPCGLRTRHDPHSFGDNNADWCDGKQPPEHYDARHRGRYLAEVDWWPSLAQAFRCKHRASGDAQIAEERPEPRPRFRLRWRDDRGVSDGNGTDTG